MFLLLLLFALLVEILCSVARPILGLLRFCGARLILSSPLADLAARTLGFAALEAAHLPLEVKGLPVLALAHRHLLPVSAAVRVIGADLDEANDPGVLPLRHVGQIEGAFTERIANGPLVNTFSVTCDKTLVTTVQIFLGVVIQLQKADSIQVAITQ